MDRAEASRISHGELRLWNPLSERALDEAIELLELAPGANVLDVACGRAEVLRRVAERWEVRGSGYDSDPALIESGPAGLDLQVRDSPPPGSAAFPRRSALCASSRPRWPGAAGRGLLATLAEHRISGGGRTPGRSGRRRPARARAARGSG